MITDDRSPRKPRPWTRETALSHLADLCARSEQCESDLRQKMRQHAVPLQDADAVIDYLVEHKFIDENRYAFCYVRDKMRFNGWGRMKITMMLRAKRISSPVVKEAVEALDGDEYYAVLLKLLRSAVRGVDLNDYTERMKLLRRLYARGFEPELIKDALDELRQP